MGAAHNLMSVDILLKLIAGLALVLFPLTVARITGLPHGNTSLWPRLLGAVLIGLAGSMYAEARLDTARGQGIVGAIIVNLAAVCVLLAVATLTPTGTRRGALALWFATIALFLLSLGQILAA